MTLFLFRVSVAMTARTVAFVCTSTDNGGSVCVCRGTGPSTTLQLPTAYKSRVATVHEFGGYGSLGYVRAARGNKKQCE